MATAKEWSWFSPGMTTGIGSLPHHNVDAALAFSTSLTVPFLPQIPIRHANEYAVPQSLQGLPGLQIEKDGGLFLDLAVWEREKDRFDAEIDKVLNDESHIGLLPDSGCWQPFLWELTERQKRVAKVQIAGPVTAAAVVRSTDKAPVTGNIPLRHQITRLILARATSMARALQTRGVTPLVFFDEPALFLVRAATPEHWSALQELKLLVQALKKQRAIVGIHCCSDTTWSPLLALEPNLLSIDTHLSLNSLLREREAFEKYWESGGRLALGIIPTHKPETLGALEPQNVVRSLQSDIDRAVGTEFTRRILSESFLTPACGLALHTPGQAETVLSVLRDTATSLRYLLSQ